MPLAAAAASGLPLLVGVWYERLDLGLVATLGGLVFLSLPDTRLQHRMVLLMAVAFATIACYALGALTHFFPAALIIALTLLTLVASMAARFYRLSPPGILFMLMAASIAAYSPTPLADIPARVGLVTLGALLACLLAFAYSLLQLRRGPLDGEALAPQFDFDRVVIDSVVIAACVGLSLLLAELLGLARPYWVPVSCLAVIQGASLRMVWNRSVQRVFGTVAGLALAWLLLTLPLGDWGIVAAMIALSFIIEVLVVRHYGLATLFITPLTILLAEAGSRTGLSPMATMQARAIDTALGGVIGLLGGMALHVPAFRARMAAAIRPLQRRLGGGPPPADPRDARE